ncbi:hypothetical protein [Bradyrhizobium jicamae]|uniref:hypothetical protein n=1 Tax=Bradyrhizobium jicamae TaxID=280332 RepID=UPI000ABED12A|nr:hypothetical protein [Bradyrhizobium jicamae]
MLTIAQIRKIAHQSGARDIDKVETDVILTYTLKLFHEQGITAHTAFKGGTMLRKMCSARAGASRPTSISRSTPTSATTT